MTNEEIRNSNKIAGFCMLLGVLLAPIGIGFIMIVLGLYKMVKNTKEEVKNNETK